MSRLAWRVKGELIFYRTDTTVLLETTQALQRLEHQAIINFIANFHKTVSGKTKLLASSYSYKRPEVEEEKERKNENKDKQAHHSGDPAISSL